MLKKLLISFAILLNSCASMQLPAGSPKPPVYKDCDIVAVEGGTPYIRCVWSTGGDSWRYKINNEFWKRKEKYFCTTDQDYANFQNYAKQLKRWADNHCK